ncbi:hypothetical protein [Paenibacillus zanthoxyli]|uniref:hypothetical protein n=1 Tax=Paenibacillus zanthoxyli TaxID=369399 RepID=UPI0004726BD8|nr:hypothetical protein [Paenibacillus zanthoxyli]
MNKRGVSMIFFSIATLLFVVRNVIHSIEATMLAANLNSVSDGTFKMFLDMTIPPYSYIFELIALVIGIIYLILAELEERK